MKPKIWNSRWRDSVWQGLDSETWDLIIVGGGITGAGILREASRMGLRTLLVEARDFASGASSRSSKLVHGGLRYLKNGQLRTTFESVRERDRLLKEGKGLIRQLGFLQVHLQSDKLPGWMFGMGLCIYDLLAKSWLHRHYDNIDMRELCHLLTTADLIDGYRFFDALTDDARLVLRLLRESEADGGTALNYCEAAELLRMQNGQICGVVLRNSASETEELTVEVKAHTLINATGAHSDRLRGQLELRSRIRPLRGSHLVFPVEKLPLTRAVSFAHPLDQRPVYALPWENVIIFGTTDIDHLHKDMFNPAISEDEAGYLMDGIHHVFPDAEIDYDDVLATFSGIRPTLKRGRLAPSKVPREHDIREEKGMVTVSGGKLTTFRLMAQDALRKVCQTSPLEYRVSRKLPILNSVKEIRESVSDVTPAEALRLTGRYSKDALTIMDDSAGYEKIDTTPYMWSELSWAARAEAVVHLEDLLLRRVRLGLLLPNGGRYYREQIGDIVWCELDWDDTKWENEWRNYQWLWRTHYSLPSGSRTY